MPKQSISFHHSDISSLAKSLKGFLADDCQCDISHVKVLNYLAKSGGHQNFQALRAAGMQDAPRGQESVSQLVVMESRAGITREIFPKAPDGTYLDRRHAPVDTFKVCSVVDITLGKLHGAVGITVEVPFRNVEKLVKPERSLAELAVHHLLTCAVKGGVKPFGLTEAKFDTLNAPRVGQARTLETGGNIGWCLLPGPSASALQATLARIVEANGLYYRVTEFLNSLAFAPSPVIVGRAQSARIKACEEFLTDYVQRCYAGMVNSWHMEKLPAVCRALRALSSGRQPDGYDFSQFQRNIGHFQLTDYWRDTPMPVPELTLDVVLEAATP